MKNGKNCFSISNLDLVLIKKNDIFLNIKFNLFNIIEYFKIVVE